MKKFLLRNINLPGGALIGMSLPFGARILPGNYDILFLIPGLILLIISYYYTFYEPKRLNNQNGIR